MNRKRKNFNKELTKRSKYALPFSNRKIPFWCYRFVRGVSKKNRRNMTYLPQEYMLNKITSEKRIAFIGDIMELKERDLLIGKDVKEYLKGVDFLIGNFEATITKEKRIFMDQRHKEQIIDSLEDLFPPEKTFLSVANNHSGDYGATTFLKSCQKLLNRGYTIFGTKQNPYIDLPGEIRIIGGSMWSNRPCDYIVNFYDTPDYIDGSKFNILYPHWGIELFLYPKKPLIKIAEDFILKFDAIIGHHAHVPQPITYKQFNGTKKLLAYSLGDFSYGDDEKTNLYHYKYGIILETILGLDGNGVMKIGDVRWKFVESHGHPNNSFVVKTQSNIEKLGLFCS